MARRRRGPGIKLDPQDWVVRPSLADANALRTCRSHHGLRLERIQSLIDQRHDARLMDRVVRSGQPFSQRVWGVRYG